MKQRNHTILSFNAYTSTTEKRMTVPFSIWTLYFTCKFCYCWQKIIITLYRQSIEQVKLNLKYQLMQPYKSFKFLYFIGNHRNNEIQPRNWSLAFQHLYSLSPNPKSLDWLVYLRVKRNLNMRQMQIGHLMIWKRWYAVIKTDSDCIQTCIYTGTPEIGNGKSKEGKSTAYINREPLF